MCSRDSMRLKVPPEVPESLESNVCEMDLRKEDAVGTNKICFSSLSGASLLIELDDRGPHHSRASGLLNGRVTARSNNFLLEFDTDFTTHELTSLERCLEALLVERRQTGDFDTTEDWLSLRIAENARGSFDGRVRIQTNDEDTDLAVEFQLLSMSYESLRSNASIIRRALP
jgi:hypothetical protein